VTLYLDTSHLIKLYIDEAGSAAVQALVDRSAVVVTSVLAYAEARATFARRRRERLMTAEEARAATGQLDADWPRFLVIPVDDAIGRSAGRLAEVHRLRGADAVHLASFEALLARGEEFDLCFSCADARLVRAAKSLGRGGEGR